MSKSKFGLDFFMKPLLSDLEKELSSLTSILEKELSSIFRDVATVHYEHKILKDIQRHTIPSIRHMKLIDSILAQYNAFFLAYFLLTFYNLKRDEAN